MRLVPTHASHRNHRPIGDLMPALAAICLAVTCAACFTTSPSGGNYSENIMVGDSILTPGAKIVLLDIIRMQGGALRCKVGITWRHTGEYEEHLIAGMNATRSAAHIKPVDESFTLEISQEEAIVDQNDMTRLDRKSARLLIKEIRETPAKTD